MNGKGLYNKPPILIYFYSALLSLFWYERIENVPGKFTIFILNKMRWIINVSKFKFYAGTFIRLNVP